MEKFRGFFRRDLGILILSVIIALLMWFYVGGKKAAEEKKQSVPESQSVTAEWQVKCQL